MAPLIFVNVDEAAKWRDARDFDLVFAGLILGHDLSEHVEGFLVSVGGTIYHVKHDFDNVLRGGVYVRHEAAPLW